MIEYHVSSDGNHRTLRAKLVAADYIRARVYTFKLQSYQDENYKRVQSNLSDYTKFVRVYNLQQKRGNLEDKAGQFSKGTGPSARPNQM